MSASRTNTVFGYGDFNASLMIVGEAPGQQEDLSGNPFVGRAGKLLDKMLTAINRSREKTFLYAMFLNVGHPKIEIPHYMRSRNVSYI